MSANQSKNNGFAEYLKYIPSKSLSLEYIKSNDGDFFKFIGKRLIFKLLDGALESCRRGLLLGVYPRESISREFLCEIIWRTLKTDYEEKLRCALSLVNVINATGIVIHTNLGRAPLGRRFANFDIGRYSNLEFDLETGLRGRRDEHLRGLITSITGAEDAICVNNNAAAVLLVSAALASGGDVIIRRSESVEIGEGFRINDMIKAGGARVIDTGATNSCNLSDYQSAVTPECKIAARIHTSNYRVSGYVKSLDDKEFLGFCRDFGIISYYDLGSGLLSHETIACKELASGEADCRSLIGAGFDLVSFSCDKLLGSAQAGIICGKKELIAVLRKHQLYRALRVSKETIARLQASFTVYLFSDHTRDIPVVKMLGESGETVGARCVELLSSLQNLADYKTIVDNKILKFELAAAQAAAGGGTTPEKKLSNPAVYIRLDGGALKNITLEFIAREMRLSKHHVVGYIDSDAYILNLRTVFCDEIPMIAEALGSLFKKIIQTIG